MAILNYTTTIDSYKTVAEIENILVQHGVVSIIKEYNNKSIESLRFLIDVGYTQIPIKIPAKIDACLKVLEKEKKSGTKNIKATREQAERVAWRILKDWLLAQMALIDINMARLEEVFMPYITDNNGHTLFEKLEQNNFLLESKEE